MIRLKKMPQYNIFISFWKNGSLYRLLSFAPCPLYAMSLQLLSRHWRLCCQSLSGLVDGFDGIMIGRSSIGKTTPVVSAWDCSMAIDFGDIVTVGEKFNDWAFSISRIERVFKLGVEVFNLLSGLQNNHNYPIQTPRVFQCVDVDFFDTFESKFRCLELHRIVWAVPLDLS